MNNNRERHDEEDELCMHVYGAKCEELNTTTI